MAMSLMLSLPGTPVIWYGDEIGMGDNLDLPERMSVRTPMQWSSEPNGGFSTAAPKDCVRQPVSEGPFAYAHVNAESQRVDPNSMFSVTQRLIRARRSAPEIGWGSCRVIDLGETSVIALLAEWQGGRVLTLHNLSEEPVMIDCGEALAGAPVRPLLKAGIDVDRTDDACRIRLGAYGYEWLRVSAES